MIDIFSSKVLRIKDLTNDVKLFRLLSPANFNFKAGQYLSLSVIKSGKNIRKPFSIVNPPREKSFIEFCIKIIPNGVASEYVRKLKLGDEVELFGPAGKFVVNDFNKDLIFIAGGVGIAPFMSIISDLLNRKFNKKIILIKSSRTENDSLYDAELEELSAEYPNFVFYNVFSNPRRKDLDIGYVQDFLEKYTPEKFSGDFYICGLKEMIERVEEKLLSLGFKQEQIFKEKFD